MNCDTAVYKYVGDGGEDSGDGRQKDVVTIIRC